MTYRIKYLRDKNKFPVACLAIYLPTLNKKKASKKVTSKKKVASKKVTSKKSKKTRLSYQFSVLNPNDLFNKEMGRQLALGRLVEKPHYVSVLGSVNKHKITEAVLNDLLTQSGVPGRALKAARQWLKVNQDVK